MWIAKHISSSTSPKATLGSITQASDASINVQSDLEYRSISVSTPYGFAFSPVEDQNCVVMPIYDQNICLGFIMKDQNLQAGDVRVFSPGSTASITLHKDGSIDINGNQVRINGNAIE